MKLSTLADVRELMRHLPAKESERPTWRHAELESAAAGADVVDVGVALRNGEMDRGLKTGR
jgi:hypothetical protein